MVQRKLPTKLTLQLDHAKTQTLSLSPHHHDVKSPRGAAAKKMKKSGATKRPKQPGKPPPPMPLSKTAATPNYMKSTTSSDARKELSKSKAKMGCSSSIKKSMKTGARMLTKNPSFKPARTAAVRKRGPVVLYENLDAQRATCSSTLKDFKFPAFLSLNPGGTESLGTSEIRVCPYTYCSLNGYHHPPLPPLKCFLSARRRAVKTQKSMKLGCVSPRPVDDLKEEEVKDFFVEIFTAGGGGDDEREDQEERVCDEFEPCQEVSVEEERDEGFLNESLVKSRVNDVFYEQDSDGSEMEWERDYCLPLQLDYGQEFSPQTDVEAVLEEQIIKEEEFVIKSEGKDCCFDEFMADEASQESFDEEGFSSDAFSSSNDGETNDLDDDDDDDDLKSLSTYETSAPLQALVEEAEESSDGASHEEAVAVTGDESTVAGHNISCKVEGKNAAEGETEDVLLRFKANSKKVVREDDDEVGAFNPRGPNFLPVEADPGAEKVDLRHQDLDERKNAEEWMVDYALRQVVTNLGPARKRKVSLLVEAFEKVMPANKWDLQLKHGSAFDQPRPIQACR